MIFTKQKPLDEILGILSGADKVCVLGCSECATACLTGGEEQIAEMKTKLEAAGKTVTIACVPPGGGLCCMPAFKKSLTDKTLRQAVKDADCILTFGCGTGAHSVGLVTKKLVYNGNNAHFIGVEAPFKEFLERCAGCGHCELGWTGGICPVTMCSKGLLNGPCGGVEAGKCEVDRERDCGWVLIHKRLEELGKLDQLDEIRFTDHEKTPHEVALDI